MWRYCRLLQSCASLELKGAGHSSTARNSAGSGGDGGQSAVPQQDGQQALLLLFVCSE